MTTNNLGITGLSAPVADIPSPTALGLPDAETIAQLANALFNALPDRPTVPGTAADVQAAPPTSALPSAPPLAPEGELASLPVAPYVSPTSGFSPASDAELRSVPASLASVGGVAPPSTAATPPDESPLYFLDPAQPGLPGTTVGFGPSSATRVESGAMPTTPSPPSAFAQPAEPNLRTLPATAGGAVALAPTTASSASQAPAPFSFRPELAPASAPLPAAAGEPASPPPSIPTSALPEGGGSHAANEASAITPTTEPNVNSASLSGSPSQEVSAASSPYYFLDGASLKIPDSTLSNFDPYGFTGLVTELEFDAFPLDSRLQDTSTRPPRDAYATGEH